MSTDLAIRDDLRWVEPAPVPAEHDLIAWAREAQCAHDIAVQLAATPFVPKSMQHNPGSVTGAILAGRELGLAPMSALRSIDIIDGTPAMRAHALRGLVQSHGHDVWVEESTEHRAIVCGQRRGSTRVERSTWTMDRARKAGLAGKRNWSTIPTAMLLARATSEVCRLIAADVLLGMPYSAEEVGDGDTAPPAAIAAEPSPRRAGTRTMRRKPLPEPAADAPVEQPDPPPTGVDDPEFGGAVEPVQMTDAQKRRLAVAFREAGISEHADRVSFASGVVGRELTSSAELTYAEAHKVISALAFARDDPSAWPEVRRHHGDDESDGGDEGDDQQHS